MADIKILRDQLNKTISQWLFLLKNDKAVQEKSRTAFMAFLVGLTICYGVFSLYIEPLDKKIKKMRTEFSTVDNAAPLEATDLLGLAYKDLSEKNNKLEEKISMEKVQEEILREKLSLLDNEERFARIVLSLVPSAPTHLRGSAIQLTQLEPVERDGYTILPVQLDGEATYTGVTSYLQFIEKRVEVGAIDRLEIKRPDRNDGSPQTDTGELLFSVRIGRVQLGDNI